LETAVAYWNLLLCNSLTFKELDVWTDYLTDVWGKAISKDTWNLFYDFQEGFTTYEEHDLDGAWPVLIDNFVKHVLKQKA
jgi:DCN1-like protein 1/2